MSVMKNNSPIANNHNKASNALGSDGPFAAKLAGFKKLTLLEEPQAAFYAWTFEHEQSWRKQVSVGDLVLVCDVGGGTSDFSLIYVGENDGSLNFTI